MMHVSYQREAKRGYVWVENEVGEPVEIEATKLKGTGLVIRCSYPGCTMPARFVDPFHPWFIDQTLCVKHAKHVGGKSES